MPWGLILSLCGHGAILIWALVSWPVPAPEPDQSTAPVAVRLIAPDELRQAEPEPEPVPELAPPPDISRVAPVLQPVLPDPTPDGAVLIPATRPSPIEQPIRPEAAPQTPPPALPQILTEPPEAPQPVITAEPSPRPAPRPAPPTPSPVTDPTPTPTPTPAQPILSQDAIDAALAEALTETPLPIGPPMSDLEKDRLQIAVSRCWNFGALSTEAARVTITVAMTMTPEGVPEPPTIRMTDFTGGGQAAANQAFQVAYRAIRRCAGAGYPLPPEKYAQWREIEIVFNPERMRLR
ncbi:MAG: energy transducer TonB [Mangrovicoccus sp.]